MKRGDWFLIGQAAAFVSNLMDWRCVISPLPERCRENAKQETDARMCQVPGSFHWCSRFSHIGFRRDECQGQNNRRSKEPTGKYIAEARRRCSLRATGQMQIVRKHEPAKRAAVG